MKLHSAGRVILTRTAETARGYIPSLVVFEADCYFLQRNRRRWCYWNLGKCHRTTI